MKDGKSILNSTKYLLLTLGAASASYLLYVIYTDNFVNPARYSYRSLALPAAGLGMATAALLLIYKIKNRIWIKIVLFPIYSFFLYILFGALFIFLKGTANLIFL